jgi:cytoskeletal protein RodZ
MKTAGQVLQSKRLEKRLEISDVSRITKIRPQLLELIEADDYTHLPSGAVAKGFVRNYSEFLGLKPDYVLAIFRRDFGENSQGQIVPRGMVDPVNKQSLWTPRSSVVAAVVCIFVVFAAYLIYQYNILTGPPTLRLISPSPTFSTTEATVEVEGFTDPEATISVGNQLVALDKGGHFSFRLNLNPGTNSISVTAISKSKKTTTLTRSVILTTPPPTQ